MWIFIMMLCFDLVTPALMTVGGIVMLKIKKVNALLGYRTALSMKNEDIWRYANSYCGRLWLKIGLIMLAVTVMGFIPLLLADYKVTAIVGSVIMLLQLVALLASIVPVEKELGRCFDSDGKRLYFT